MIKRKKHKTDLGRRIAKVARRLNAVLTEAVEHGATAGGAVAKNDRRQLAERCKHLDQCPQLLSPHTATNEALNERGLFRSQK